MAHRYKLVLLRFGHRRGNRRVEVAREHLLQTAQLHVSGHEGVQERQAGQRAAGRLHHRLVVRAVKCCFH